MENVLSDNGYCLLQTKIIIDRQYSYKRSQNLFNVLYEIKSSTKEFDIKAFPKKRKLLLFYTVYLSSNSKRVE